MVQYCVITKVPMFDPRKVPKDGLDSTEDWDLKQMSGNLYDTGAYIHRSDTSQEMVHVGLIYPDDFKPEPGKLIWIRHANFVKGEIIVVDDTHREIGGHGRKPSKWFVDAEYFETVEEAIECVRNMEAADNA